MDNNDQHLNHQLSAGSNNILRQSNETRDGIHRNSYCKIEVKACPDGLIISPGNEKAIEDEEDADSTEAEKKIDDKEDINDDDTRDVIELIKAKQKNSEQYISQITRRLNSTAEVVDDLVGQVGNQGIMQEMVTKLMTKSQA
ncbi:hypothetical protein B0T26DRAFT_680921 [Lasiosphaeria miniovina]|uniref:Uncharacterized protein n=1 Tax=Lasiosphaeria miniovina TaxID=1954250 RepID=A0AA39ZT86_9PEZI|nr:uncharacterized protein B0T26DRAFT_680921 [Lasiosphaeria miniovina]KAK0703197.1 hypothetical protein B0T26DRAFT_680921 [Lasiosphaeria miniovina]